MIDQTFIVPPVFTSRVVEIWCHHAHGCDYCRLWDIMGRTVKPCPVGVMILRSFYHLLHSADQ